MVTAVNSRDLFLQASITRSTNNSLLREEKPGFINLYNQILAARTILDAQATKYSIVTEKSTFDNAVAALTTYLGTLTVPVLWSNVTNITLFSSRAAFDQKFTDVYNAKTTLELAIGTRTDVTGYLTVSSIVLAADSAGVVADFTPSAGIFKVTSGSSDITGLGPVYSLVSSTGITSSINATTGAYSTTAMSLGAGKSVFRAVYAGKTMDLTYTVVKGGVGASGTSYRTCYMASVTTAAASTPNPQTDAGSTTTPGSGTIKWGLVGTWSLTVMALNTGEFMYQTDGIYNPVTNQTTWSVPYWSTLKVGSLSAISANIGSVTAGDINGVTLHGGAGYPTGAYSWPTGTVNGGFHLSASGLLIGNANAGKYLQITSDGNIYAPGFSIINGAAAFSGSLSGASVTGASGTFSGTLSGGSININNKFIVDSSGNATITGTGTQHTEIDNNGVRVYDTPTAGNPTGLRVRLGVW